MRREYDSETGLELLGPFTVRGRQVMFTKGNLYWDGTKFCIEKHSFDSPTSRYDRNHIGYFFWNKDKDDAIAPSYLNGSTTPTGLFAADGGAIEGLTVLSGNEFESVRIATTTHRKLNHLISIEGKACVVLLPDGFTDTLNEYYTANQWESLEQQYGLVALPACGYMYDSSGGGYYIPSYYGSSAYYWTNSFNTGIKASSIEIPISLFSKKLYDLYASFALPIRLVKFI